MSPYVEYPLANGLNTHKPVPYINIYGGRVKKVIVFPEATEVVFSSDILKELVYIK